MTNVRTESGEVAWGSPESAPGNEVVRLCSIRIAQAGIEGSTADIDIAKETDVQVRYWSLTSGQQLYVALALKDTNGSFVLATSNLRSKETTNLAWEGAAQSDCLFQSTCTIPGNFLNEGRYVISVIIGQTPGSPIICEDSVLTFDVHDTGAMHEEYIGNWAGPLIRPRLPWNTVKKESQLPTDQQQDQLEGSASPQHGEKVRPRLDAKSVGPPADLVGLILAGGLGTRLQGVRADCPKPLIPCAGRPFIDWVLRYFQRAGVGEFVVSLGHLAEMAQQYFDQREATGLRISTVVEQTPMGTGGAIAFAWKDCPDRVAFVLNGDSLLFADFRPLWKMWSESCADALIVGIPQDDASRFGTLTFAEDGRLLSFVEKKPGRGIINAGIYLLHPRLLSSIPPGVPLSLERDIIPGWIQEGRDIRVCVITGPFLDIGLPESLASADDFLRQNWPEGPIE